MQDKDCVHSTMIPQTHLASCWGWYEAAGSLSNRKGDWRAILGKKKFSQFSPNHRASPFFFSNMRCVLPPVIPLCRSGSPRDEWAPPWLLWLDMTVNAT